MFKKPAFGLLTFLCFTKSLQAQSSRTMSNFSGIHSVAYVTVPKNSSADEPDAVAKKLAQ